MAGLRQGEAELLAFRREEARAGSGSARRIRRRASDPPRPRRDGRGCAGSAGPSRGCRATCGSSCRRRSRRRRNRAPWRGRRGPARGGSAGRRRRGRRPSSRGSRSASQGMWRSSFLLPGDSRRLYATVVPFFEAFRGLAGAAPRAAGGRHASDFFLSVFVVRYDNARRPALRFAPRPRASTVKWSAKLSYSGTLPEMALRYKRKLGANFCRRGARGAAELPWRRKLGARWRREQGDAE